MVNLKIPKSLYIGLVMIAFSVLCILSPVAALAQYDEPIGGINYEGQGSQQQQGQGSQQQDGQGSQQQDGQGSQQQGDVTGGSGANANIKLFDPIDKSIEEIFQAILDIIMVFAIPIVLFFIVWAGFLYVTARGDTTQLEKAHKALLYAVLGGIIVVGAQALLYVITNTIALFGN